MEMLFEREDLRGRTAREQGDIHVRQWLGLEPGHWADHVSCAHTGLPGRLSGKESACECIGGFDPLEKGEATHPSILA